MPRFYSRDGPAYGIEHPVPLPRIVIGIQATLSASAVPLPQK